MDNEVAVTSVNDQATAFSMLVSNPSTRAVLDRAFDCTATFTAADIGLIEPIASAVLARQPATERTIRQSLGTLSAAMPAQAANEAAGKLKLGAYLTMLADYDERAVAYACRRCLGELDWFPTVHQIIERVRDWVSPEQAAVARARAIIRSGRRAREDGDTGVVLADDLVRVRERAEAAARLSVRRPAEPVAFDTPGRLEPHQLRIPNKGDYERLFGIDPETLRAKAAAAQQAEEEADGDLLRDAYKLHIELHRAV
jgi:hypothetical protein